MIYDNLILNEKIWSQLKMMVHNNKLPHALLFHGPDGVGKEAHAIELAALLNNNRDQVTQIKKFQHPNINLILPMPREKSIKKQSSAIDCLSDKSLEELIRMKQIKMQNPYEKVQFNKATNILINSIRDIKKNLHFNAITGSRVYLIFDAEKLCYPKLESGNALLKILEEPPSNTFFILITSNKEKIIDTILSRCCDFYFKKNSTAKIEKYLNNYDHNYETSLLIKINNGSLKEILNIIHLKIDIIQIIQDSKKLIRNIMTNQNWKQYHQQLEKLFKTDKQTFKIFIKILIFIFNDLEKIKNKRSGCLILTDVKKTKILDYNKCINKIEETYQNLHKNLNPSIGLLSMLIEIKKILFIK